ncbi:MAG: hypothetical protein HQ567_32945 [Candidatus Nealsonbacteria bacterium]|nr:hypothetical protein [Candidatus Nealsonbacteria bacterium]
MELFAPTPPNNGYQQVIEEELHDPIRSPEILERVVRRLPALQEQERPVSWLADRIDVEQVAESGIAWVSFTGPDPRDAKKIINVVAEVYMEWQMEYLRNKTRPVLVELEAELDRRKEAVKRLREQRRKIEDDLSAESPSDDSRARLATMEDEILQAEEVVELLATRIIMIKCERMPRKVQLLRNAIVPADRSNPIPYKRIAIICLVWACIPLVLAGVRRVFVRWKPGG